LITHDDRLHATTYVFLFQLNVLPSPLFIRDIHEDGNLSMARALLELNDAFDSGIVVSTSSHVSDEDDVGSLIH
jgi:hypothetical protein